jgi:hypothetical protein
MSTISEQVDHFAEFHGLKSEPIRAIAEEVVLAVLKAQAKHNPMRGAHEGYAVILEELDELWAEIKCDDKNDCQRKEALHVAAMSIRFLLDVCRPKSVAERAV